MARPHHAPSAPPLIYQMLQRSSVAGNVYFLAAEQLHLYRSASQPEPNDDRLRGSSFQACKALLEWYGSGRISWGGVINRLARRMVAEAAVDTILQLNNFRAGKKRLTVQEIATISSDVLLLSRTPRAVLTRLPSDERFQTLTAAQNTLRNQPFQSVAGTLQAVADDDPMLAAQLLSGLGPDAETAVMHALPKHVRHRMMEAWPEWTEQFFHTGDVRSRRRLFLPFAREHPALAVHAIAPGRKLSRAGDLLTFAGPEVSRRLLAALPADGAVHARYLAVVKPRFAAILLAPYSLKGTLDCLRAIRHAPAIVAVMNPDRGAVILAAMEAEAMDYLSQIPVNAAVLLIDKLEPRAAFCVLSRLSRYDLERLIAFSLLRRASRAIIMAGSQICSVVRSLRADGEQAGTMAELISATSADRISRAFVAVESPAASRTLATLSFRAAGRLLSAMPTGTASQTMSEPTAPTVEWILAMRPRSAVDILCNLPPDICARLFAQMPTSMIDRFLLSSAVEVLDHTTKRRDTTDESDVGTNSLVLISWVRRAAIIWSATPPIAKLKPIHKDDVWEQLDRDTRARLVAFTNLRNAPGDTERP